MGAFTPMMRSHGADIKREIYYFGEKGDDVYDAIAEAIKLRYAMLPYIYSTSWNVTNAGGSFMLPSQHSSLRTRTHGIAPTSLCLVTICWWPQS